MPRPRRFAGERLLALCAAAAALLGGTTAAIAQEDPFALPRGVTAQSVAASAGPGLSEIAVDGETRVRLVRLEWRGRELTIDAANARVAGLPVPDGSDGLLSLDSLKIAEWHFDPVRQRLEVKLLRRSDGKNLIDLAGGARVDVSSAPLLALRVDYDLTASLARGRASAGGLVGATLVRGNLALTTDLQVTSDPAPGESAVVRLDSRLQVLIPERRITAVAGDFISAGGQSQRALRLGGLQVVSDYHLRPDLVTTPLPSFTGQVSVPTGIDLINGDQRYKLGDIEPGEFTVRNVPAATGRGEVAVITRDSLGREVVQSARFYVSRNLLARNLSEFAVNAGFVRRRFGVRSMDYGPLAANAYYRRGLSSHLTVEGTAEWTSGLVNIGARGDLALAGLALATLEARISHDAPSGATGTLFNVGLESTGRRVSGRINAILPSAGYHDVADRLGDPSPPREFLAQVSFDLGHLNQLQLSAIRQERRGDPRYPRLEPRADVVNAVMRTRIARSIELYSSLGYRRAERTSFSVFAGLSIQLGKGRNAQLSASGNTGSAVSGSATVSRHDLEGVPVGYALEQSFGPVTRTSASAAYRSPYGRVEGQVERVDSKIGLRANARGTLIAAGGAVFARNQTGGSYALVKTGTVDGVAILREHRPAGVTRNNGYLLVENIPSLVPVSFDIDADKLPADALAHDTRRRIVVPPGAVGAVKLDVVRYRPRAMRLTDAAGAALAPGAVLTAEPSGETLMVGFDGEAFVNAVGSDRRLVLRSPLGTVCAVELDPARVATLAADAAAPTLRCLPVQDIDSRRVAVAAAH